MLPASGEHLRGKGIKDFPASWFTYTLVVAMVFSLNGGYINAVSFAGVWRTGLTHLTGSTTNSAVRLINVPKVGQYTALDLGAFIVFFGLGAFVAGFILGPGRMRWGRLQGACWTLFGLAMALGWYLAPRPTDTHLGVPGGLAISFAMGIQNTVTSLFTPLTIRTSHVSGTVLDVGIGLGQCLRERNLNNMWKVKFHVPNFLAFWVGAVIGTVAYNHLGHNALLVNIAFGLLIGIVTLVVGTVFAQKKEKVEEPLDLAMESTDVAEPEYEELLQPGGSNLSRRQSAAKYGTA